MSCFLSEDGAFASHFRRHKYNTSTGYNVRTAARKSLRDTPEAEKEELLHSFSLFYLILQPHSNRH